MNDSRLVTIDSLGKIVTGSTPPAAHPEWFADSGMPFVTPSDIQDGVRFVRTSRFLSPLGSEAMQKRVVPAGTVCFVSIGSTIGKMCTTTTPSVTNQQINSVVVDDTIADPTFVYYALSQCAGLLKAIAGGSATPILNKSAFANVSLNILPIGEQRTIGILLNALDYKIESNRRTVKGILALGHALYERALTSGSRQTLVGEIAEFHNRRRIPLSSLEREARPGNIPYYGATGIFGYVDDFLFNEVLVLVGEDGSVVRDDGGPVTQYIWGKAWINNHAHPLTGRGISNELLYLALDRSDVRPLVTGAVQPKISMGNLKSLAVDLPLESEQAPLESMLSSLFSVLRCRSDEVCQLEQLRDTLLPELLSGRIRGPRTCEEVKGGFA